MPARKMKVEVFDESGNRYTIIFEGRVTREKALRIFDIIELLGGMPSVTPEMKGGSEASKIDKIRYVIEKNFPLVWFNARDIQMAYEKEMKEPINLSTVSTYLSRLSDRGVLLRNRNSNRVHYRLVSGNLQKAFNLKY